MTPMGQKSNKKSKQNNRDRKSGPSRRTTRSGKGTRKTSSGQRRHRFYRVLTLLIVAAAVLFVVRLHAILHLSARMEISETRMKLEALSEQDRDSLQNEIDLKREVAGAALPSGQEMTGLAEGENQAFSACVSELPASDLSERKSAFRNFAVACRRLGGSREQNGVLFGDNRQLMEDIVPTDEETLEKKAAALNAYAANHETVGVHLLLVPDAAGLLREKLPHSVSVADQEELFSDFAERLDPRIVWMDAFAALCEHEDDFLYYQTDHRWTTSGAYDVFLETAEDLGIRDAADIGYDSCCASCDFNGSLSAVSSFLPGAREELTVYLPWEYTSCLVTCLYEEETATSLYSPEALDSDNPYDVFPGGSHSLIEIDTGSDNMETLLVVKDSFANNFIPFLVPYYTRILVLDPCYFNGSLDEVTSSYEVSDVLFLYGGNSFFSDTGLTRILSAE